MKSHVFRKTSASVLDDANLSSRQIADQLGHAGPSITHVYMGRTVVSRQCGRTGKHVDRQGLSWFRG